MNLSRVRAKKEKREMVCSTWNITPLNVHAAWLGSACSDWMTKDKWNGSTKRPERRSDMAREAKKYGLMRVVIAYHVTHSINTLVTTVRHKVHVTRMRAAVQYVSL